MDTKFKISSRLLHGGFWILCGRITVIASGVFSTAVLTRLIDKDNVGAYFLAFSIATTLSILSLGGSSRLIIRLLGERTGLDFRIERLAVALKVYRYAFFTTVVTCVLYMIFARFLFSYQIYSSQTLKELSFIILIWAVVLAIRSLVAESLRGVHDLKGAALHNGLFSQLLFLCVLTSLYFYYHHATLLNVVAIYIIVILIDTAFALFRLFRKLYVPVKATINVSNLNIQKSALSLLGTTFTLQVMTEIHLWVLSIFRQDNEVALFGAAIRIGLLLVTPLAIVKMIIPSTLANFLHKKNELMVQNLLSLSVVISSIPSFIGILICIIIGKDLFTFLFGNSYINSYNALIPLIFGHIVNVITGFPGILLMMAGRESDILKFTILSSLVGLTTTTILVPKFGYIGAAIGAGVTIGINNIITCFFVKKTLGYDTHLSIRAIQYTYSYVKDQFSFR